MKVIAAQASKTHLAGSTTNAMDSNTKNWRRWRSNAKPEDADCGSQKVVLSTKDIRKWKPTLPKELR